MGKSILCMTKVCKHPPTNHLYPRLLSHSILIQFRHNILHNELEDRPSGISNQLYQLQPRSYLHWPTSPMSSAYKAFLPSAKTCCKNNVSGMKGMNAIPFPKAIYNRKQATCGRDAIPTQRWPQ